MVVLRSGGRRRAQPVVLVLGADHDGVLRSVRKARVWSPLKFPRWGGVEARMELTAVEGDSGEGASDV